jgi:hypothetical protein
MSLTSCNSSDKPVLVLVDTRHVETAVSRIAIIDLLFGMPNPLHLLLHLVLFAEETRGARERLSLFFSQRRSDTDTTLT